MKCPHCKKLIPERLLKTWWASLGGSASKRKITPEQQAKMQAARRKAHAKTRPANDKRDAGELNDEVDE